MIDWSIVFPTRDRQKQLASLLRSLVETTERPERLEVLIAVDDDMGIPPFTNLPFCCKILSGPRQANMSQGYYSRLAAIAEGRYVQAMNDDVQFLTPGWDRIAVEAMDSAAHHFNPPAYYGQCEDGYGAFFACFPVLTRAAIDAQGYFFHPGFTGWGADIHLCRMWRALNRIVELPFRLHHDLPAHDPSPDETHLRMRNISVFAHETVGAECSRIEQRLKATASV